MTSDAFPRVNLADLEADLEAAGYPLMPHEMPQCFTMELSFPGYIRGMIVCSIAFEAEEKEPGYIRRLPKQLAVECAHADHGLWLAINDPIVPNDEWLAQRIEETGGNC